MKIFLYCIQSLLLVILSFTIGYAQHEHAAAPTTGAPLSFAPVLSTLLSDPDLKKYNFQSTLLTIIPGGSDTIAHRHDAEIFGFIVEGAIQLGLEYKEPVTFNAGQMFYEKRNVVHNSIKNLNDQAPAKVLLITIIKNGRERYTRLHPQK